MVIKKLGEILLESNLITETQLSEALELQKSFPGETIGRLLCRLGFLKETDLNYILEQTGKRKKLVDILLAEGLLSEGQLERARVSSKKDNIPLGKSLVKLGFLTEEQLARTVSVQYDLPFVSLGTMQVDQDFARFINANYAQKQQIVPISKIGSTLTLAMVHPIKLSELKELESATRLKIIPVIATESEIAAVQQRLYKFQQAPAHSIEDEMSLDIPDSISDILTKTDMYDEPDIEDEVKKVTERDSVIVKLVNKIIYDAYQNRASDIHIEPYPGKNDIIVRVRIDGRCKVYQRIPYKYKYAIPSRIKIMSDLDIAERRKPQDGKINFKKFGPINVELRIATMPTVGQLEDVVIRILHTGDPIAYDDLGLTERNRRVFEKAITKPYGLILVVGPTGSGKTTTLHSAIARINKPETKIWTAEDPVEITQKGLRQVQVNPRIGLTFAAALRSFLRLDPDIIMVGEMRDEETASIAIEASLTGHLVLSTLHTNTAPETLTRLLDMGIDPFAFSDSLLCVLAQRLARRLCKKCMRVYRPEESELAEIIAEYGAEQFLASGLVPADLTLAEPVGCEDCSNTGYRGRMGIHELLDCSDEIKNLIKKKPEAEEIRREAVIEGMTSLKQDGILKVFQHLTDIHEVRRICIR
ncbi:MAG: pilus assembly protein PilB [Deltaproteobacteria bacterium]|nr:pilus assembly protein PilB [Deltaproteobacteria bacterium]TLN03214.1 MAG: pilus assembly protein PilB [bacterium]